MNTRFTRSEGPGAKHTIADVRTILVVLSDEERQQVLNIPFNIEDYFAWWIAKLKIMGCWVVQVLTVYQVKAGDKWTNGFKVKYK